MATILLALDVAPDEPPKGRAGYRADPPLRLGPRRSMWIGSKYVEYADDGVLPTQADVDAFMALAAADAAAQAKVATQDADVRGFTFGGETLASLKAMDSPTFNAWWAANVNSLAQANVVLRLLAKAALHRML